MSTYMILPHMCCYCLSLLIQFHHLYERDAELHAHCLWFPVHWSRHKTLLAFVVLDHVLQQLPLKAHGQSQTGTHTDKAAT